MSRITIITDNGEVVSSAYKGVQHHIRKASQLTNSLELSKDQEDRLKAFLETDLPALQEILKKQITTVQEPEPAILELPLDIEVIFIMFRLKKLLEGGIMRSHYSLFELYYGLERLLKQQKRLQKQRKRASMREAFRKEKTFPQ